MSLSMQARIWRILLRSIFKNQHLSPEESREQDKKNARFMNRGQSGVNVKRVNADGIPAAWILPDNAQQDTVILHLHGGGYVIGGIDSHQMMCSVMAKRTGLNLLLPEYRLAPEFPFPAALEDVQKSYRWLLSQGYQPEKIIISGDSAGGGLAVSTVLALREANMPLPAALVCISPWADLTFKGQSHLAQIKSEVLLTTDKLLNWQRFYTAKEDPSNPLISPVYASFHDFPPLLIHVGSNEVLLDDARMLAQKAKDDGAKVTLKIWPEMWHVWHAVGELMPESRQAFDEIGQFIAFQMQKTEDKKLPQQRP
jgi:epsilon-lactone hydrolase